MGRKKNDGRGRLGGRQKGTPNKAARGLKEAMARIVEGYFTTPGESKESNYPGLSEDLSTMTPEGRAKTITGLVGYIVPKRQALSIEDQAKIEEQALFAFLESAPEEAIEAISSKILEKQKAIMTTKPNLFAS